MLRLGARNPAYDVFIDREARQFLTFSHEKKKWLTGKIDRLTWGRDWWDHAERWLSPADAKLEKLIGWNLLNDRLDIYGLNAHKDMIVMLEGFGEKSWQNLWDAIQRSRNTTFERYLIAMDIPMAVKKKICPSSSFSKALLALAALQSLADVS